MWDRMAPTYERGGRLDRWLMLDARSWACSQASGETLEIAVGTGLNLPCYPDGLSLTAVEISPVMLSLARERADSLGRPYDLRLGDAQQLDFEADQFDTVVCTLALCAIPDERRAIDEIWRVLRPGGGFISVEHVRSPNRAVRAVERLLDGRSVRMQGDHLLRDPLDHLEPAGFIVEEVRRWRLGFMQRTIARKAPRGDTV